MHCQNALSQHPGGKDRLRVKAPHPDAVLLLGWPSMGISMPVSLRETFQTAGWFGGSVTEWTLE